MLERPQSRSSRRAFMLGAVAVLGSLHFGAMPSAEPCGRMSPDFSKTISSARHGAAWSSVQMQTFLRDSVLGSIRLVIPSGETRCFSIEDLPAVDTLRATILAAAGDQAAFEHFLHALSALTCELIADVGRPVPCDPALALVAAARRAALGARTYDPAYVRIDSIGGDVRPERGVCSDVVIRGLRAVGVDLQSLVHADMKAHFERYRRNQPGDWTPDPSIDHRRVTNLSVYLSHDTTRFVVIRPPDRDWQPGDIVVWNLKSGQGFLPHIGVVSDSLAIDGGYRVIHHLPPSGSEDDRLHEWGIIGHYRPTFR